MPTTCKIVFQDNPERVFYSGQLMIGTIHFNLTNQKRVRKLYLKIKGLSETYKLEYTTDGTKNRGTSQNLLREKIYLIGNERGATDTVLKPGAHSFSFETFLPVGLPSSFQGKYAYVQYNAIAVIWGGWADKYFSTPFTIVKNVDLNAYYPSLRQPMFAQVTDKFDVSVPVGGYIAGQTINFIIKTCKLCDQVEPKFKVQLKITYKFTLSYVKVKDTVLAEAITNDCAPNTDGIYHVNIQVPPVPPTEEVALVEFRYFCLISNANANNVVLPIVIGTIALTDPPSAPPIENSSTANAINNDSKPFIQFPNDEPPTYEEAMQNEN